MAQAILVSCELKVCNDPFFFSFLHLFRLLHNERTTCQRYLEDATTKPSVHDNVTQKPSNPEFCTRIVRYQPVIHIFVRPYLRLSPTD